MNEIPFHTTRMGQQYYERTLPELVRQIERLAEAIERLMNHVGVPGEPPANADE